MAEELLTARGLTMQFGGLKAVDSVDFSIPAGQVVSLIGPNGAGKTTFFNMLTGLYIPTEGSLNVLGKNVTGRAPHVIASLGVARTFQNIRLFTSLTALDNVLVGMHSKLRGGMWKILVRSPGLRAEEREAEEKARQLLAYVGLKGVEGEAAGNLAYGDQRRLEIARALAASPRIVLLDEPAAGMNPQETASLGDLIADIPGATGAAVLLIEHEMKLVMRVSQRVSVLDYGRKISEGTPDEVRNDPAVIDAYLGGADGEITITRPRRLMAQG